MHDETLLSLPMAVLNQRLIGLPYEEVEMLKKRRRNLRSKKCMANLRARRMVQENKLGDVDYNETNTIKDTLMISDTEIYVPLNIETHNEICNYSR